MKKLCFLIFLLAGTLSAQDDERRAIEDRKHEVKVGAVKLLAGPILEGTYEYIKNSDFTFGTSVLANFDTGNDYPEDFSITPFARFYFQESREYGAQGFFVEGFAKYSTGEHEWNSDNVEAEYSCGAVGISLGKKWINRTGFVFEILVGGGRTIGGGMEAPDFLFRGDLNLGYRF